MLRDQQLLFGIVAVQFTELTAKDLYEVSLAWMNDPSRALADYLGDAGKLSDSDRQFVEQSVTRLVELHDGDAGETLRNIGGASSVYESFGGSMALDTDGSLVSMGGDAADGSRTGAGSVDVGQVTAEHADRYRVEGEVGRGGIGKVLVALDTHVGRKVAIKELLVGATAGGSSTGRGPRDSSNLSPRSVRFLREARVTGQLEHPAIIPVHEIGQRPDGTLYYTMKLVRGQTMAESLRGRRSYRERIELLGHYADLCQAVAYAHSRGVVHRDIKPDNVMGGEFGETVVLDWGLAKVRGQRDERSGQIQRQVELMSDGAAGHTVDGHALGTPAYMSPEQADGDIDAIDERSDVWSLGAVLYEILTGRPPFEGSAPFEIIAKVIKQPIPSVRSICPEASQELAAICEKALSRERRERYAGANDLSAEIVAFQSGARVAAHEYSSWELLRRFARRNKALTIAAGVVMAVVVAALGVVAVSWRAEQAARADENRERVLARYHLAQAHTTRAADLLERRRVSSARAHAAAGLLYNPANPRSPHHDPALAGELEGSRIMLARARGVAIRAQLSDRLRLLRKLSIDADARCAAFSPDGERLVAGGVGGDLYSWNTRSYAAAERLPAYHGDIYNCRYAGSAERLATAGLDGKARLWDLTARRELAIFESGTPAVYDVDLSAAGDRMAMLAVGSEVSVWSTAESEKLGAWKTGTGTAMHLALSPDGTRVVVTSDPLTLRDAVSGETVRVFSDADIQGFLDFGPRGELLATGSFSGDINLWRVSDGALLANARGHEDMTALVEFSSDGRLLVSGGDTSICLWAVPELRLLTCVEAHPSLITAGDIAPGTFNLVSAGFDSTVKIWEIERQRGSDVRVPSELFFRMAFSPDNRLVAATGMNGGAWVWDREDAMAKRRVDLSSSQKFGMAFSPDGTRLAFAGPEGTVWIIAVDTLELVTEIAEHVGAIARIAYSPDGTALALAGNDGQVWLVDTATSKLRALQDFGPSALPAIAFSPSGDLIAATGSDSLVQLIDPATGRAIRALKGHEDDVTGLSFSGDGAWLASSGQDASVRIWSTKTWESIATLREHDQWVNDVIFSPDHRYLVSAGDDRNVILWSTSTWEPLVVLEGTTQVAAIAFSPDMKTLSFGDGEWLRFFPMATLVEPIDPEAALAGALEQAGLRLDGFNLKID